MIRRCVSSLWTIVDRPPCDYMDEESPNSGASPILRRVSLLASSRFTVFAFAFAFALAACAIHAPPTPVVMEPIDQPALERSARNPPPPPAEPPAPAFKPTNELVSDPATQAKVDRLAKATRQLAILDDGTQVIVSGIDYSDEGPNGYNHASYLIYEDLIASISVADAVALIHHENPGVRAYFALYASTHLGDLAPPLLRSLFNDTTLIATMRGDRGHTETVGEYAMRRLSHCCRGPNSSTAPNSSQMKP